MRRPDSYFWPDQVLRDAVACLGVLVVVLLLCLRFALTHGTDDPGRLGAHLGAPADPSEPFEARPEWYFLFLFQFLKYFPGETEVYGAVVVPGAAMGLLFLMPLIGRFRVGHWFNVAVTVALMVGVVVLTTMALVEDAGRPHVAVPMLGRLGPTFTTVMLAVLAVVVLALLPLALRERSFRSAAVALGGAAAATAFVVLVAVSGGGAPGTGRPVALGGQTFELHRLLLAVLLAELVLLITIVLLKSPVRVSGRLPAGRSITAAADAEVPDAIAAHAEPNDGGPGDLSWIRRWELHHRIRLAMVLLVLGGVVLLTAISLVGGAGKPGYQRAVAAADREAERVVELASLSGIPPQGAISLLRNDPATQGPKLFARNCASCHRYDGHDGLRQPHPDPQSAPDLNRFATRDWIGGMLHPQQVDRPRYFGPHMKAHTGKMVQFVKEDVAEATDEEDKRDLGNIVVALAAEAQLTEYREADARDAAVIAAGREAMSESVFECTNCHAFRGAKPSLGGDNRGPDLTGYGSRQWLIDFIKNPEHPRFYPGEKNDRMPLYGEQKILDDRSIALIADWIRGDLNGPSGGAESSSAAATDPAPATPAATAPAATAPSVPVPTTTAPATTAPSMPQTPPAQTRPAETRPSEPNPSETKPAEPMPAPPMPPSPKPQAPPGPAPQPTDSKAPAPHLAEPKGDAEPIETEFEITDRAPAPAPPAEGPPPAQQPGGRDEERD